MKKLAELTKIDFQLIPQGARLNPLTGELSKSANEMLKHFKTGKQFIEQFNFDYCRERYISYKSIEQALFAKTIKIRELASCYGDNVIQLWIEAWLVSLSMHMNFEINESQAKETAISLIEKLYILNITEITLFFRKLRHGDYGKFYGKYEMQLILIGASKYRTERGLVLSSKSTDVQQELLR